MKGNPFESQLERLARTLTEQFGVQVVCQGDNAWTDGTQIALPSVPEPLDENLEKCLIGYLDHELGHVAFSDFGVAGEFARKHPGYEGLLNVVEDPSVVMPWRVRPRRSSSCLKSLKKRRMSLWVGLWSRTW